MSCSPACISEINPPGRLVFTEMYEEGPGAPRSRGRRVLDGDHGAERGAREDAATVTARYASSEIRDIVVSSGMERGAAISYDRLEEVAVSAFSAKVEVALPLPAGCRADPPAGGGVCDQLGQPARARLLAFRAGHPVDCRAAIPGRLPVEERSSLPVCAERLLFGGGEYCGLVALERVDAGPSRRSGPRRPSNRRAACGPLSSAARRCPR